MCQIDFTSPVGKASRLGNFADGIFFVQLDGYDGDSVHYDATNSSVSRAGVYAYSEVCMESKSNSLKGTSSSSRLDA